MAIQEISPGQMELKDAPEYRRSEMKKMVLFHKLSRISGQRITNLTFENDGREETIQIVPEITEGTGGCFGSPDFVSAIRISSLDPSDQRWFRLGSFSYGKMLDEHGKPHRDFDEKDIERLEQILKASESPNAIISKRGYGEKLERIRF